MDRREWRQEILSVPVFDTHTHLNIPGVPVTARDFWDIAHYFWFLEELWSVGYPAHASDLPREERIERFVAAYAATRNTVWHAVVDQVFQRLYGITLGDADSVRQADEAVRASHQQAGWARAVIDRLSIRSIAVNHIAHADYPGLPGVGVAVPIGGGYDRDGWVQRILGAGDQREAGREAARALRSTVGDLYASGIRGMRASVEPLQPYGEPGPDELPARGADRALIEAYLTHVQLCALADHGMFAQIFLGIARVTPHTSMAFGDPRRITDLYPLFERYACGFELVIGSPRDNMDAAQPARIYPNVHVGGLWWYNFRSSTYRQAMQYRLEAVPAAKSAIVASDARCIEWCYAKILLIKWLLADYLYEQVSSGWLDRSTALWVAQEWLHDAAARRYLP
jgi:glucuronate isomerase